MTKKDFTCFFMLTSLLTCCLLTAYPLDAKEDRMSSAYFSGQFEGHMDSVLVIFLQDFVYNEIGKNEFIVYADDRNSFNFRIEEISHVGKLKMILYDANDSYVIEKYVEPGDSINIGIRTVAEGGVLTKYSGDGSMKYICQDELDVEKKRFEKYRTYSAKRGLYDLIDLEADIRKLYEISDLAASSTLIVLDAYKEAISTEIYRVLKSEYLCYYSASWEMQIQELFKKSNNIQNIELKRQIIDSYNKNRALSYVEDDSIAALSNIYVTLLVERNKVDLFFRSNGIGYEFKELYTQLKANYIGLLREKLITYFLYDYRSDMNVINYSPEQFNYCLDDASQFIQTGYLKEALANRLVLKTGTKVFDFSLTDTLGRIVTLEDFDGKVVLLDVWGDGCTGCARFASFFRKNVYPDLKNNPNFKVVSINIDRDRKRWLNALNSGKYAEKDYVNLFTNGMGINHPFIEYYNIQAIPFILLIDQNGKIYSRIPITLTKRKILSVINKALNSVSLN